MRRLVSLLWFVPPALLLCFILMPVVNVARPAAQKATCLSNMKQIGNALLLYAADWDDRLPPASKWEPATLPHVESEQVFICPSDAVGRRGTGHSYALNRVLAAQRRPEDGGDAAVLVFESDLHAPNAAGGPESVAARRHEDGSNYVFADGRVRWLKTPPSFVLPRGKEKR